MGKTYKDSRESRKMVDREVKFMEKKGAPKDMIRHERREAKVKRVSK